ncbi:hypothetical protein MYX84_08155 [Acidobacteria bacterium AH-259-O06]|nr:hypothetical protein [Acidobacteria bacterium AH-259-O06]
MSERRVLIKSFAPRYRRSRKKVKSELLTQFTEMSGYNRCYAAYLLRHQGRGIRLRGKVVAVADATKRVRRQRARKYDRAVLEALKQIWQLLACAANAWWPSCPKSCPFWSAMGS